MVKPSGLTPQGLGGLETDQDHLRGSVDTPESIGYSYVMPKNTNRRPQTAKVKSPDAKALTLSRRGGVGDRIPSATAYKRPKSNANMWSE